MTESAAGRKARAERLAILGAALLAGAKLATGLAIDSIGLLSSAADSLIDVGISSLNLLSLRIAASPADEGHPYGHGKAENLAGLVQTAVIAAVGVWLIVEAGRRYGRGARPEAAEWGVAVMALSTGVSWLVARHLRRVGRETDSVVLLADSLHYATDVWTNAGVLVALALARWTGAPVWDPLIAVAVAAVILGSAWQLLGRSVRDLMDAALPPAEQRAIEGVIRQHRFVRSFHDLRTRRAGPQRQVDVSVVACRHLPLGDVHDLVDHVQREIEAVLPGAHAVIHPEPCPAGCPASEGCVRGGRDTGLFDHAGAG
jgi:cation diffusion facilitator family transporter